MASDVGASLAAVRKWWFRNSIPSDKWKAVLGTRVARDKGLRAEMLAELAASPLEAAR